MVQSNNEQAKTVSSQETAGDAATKLTQEDIDHDMGIDDECWQCGGEGYFYSCPDEIGCVDPEGGCDLCERRCDICNPRKARSTAA